MRPSSLLTASVISLFAACSSSSDGTTLATSGDQAAASTTGDAAGAGGSSASTTGSGASASGAGGAGGGAVASSGAGGMGTGGGGAPSAADLLALIANCTQVSNGKYKTDADANVPTIAVCGLKGAVFWQSDMDIDCDGKTTAQCNINTDPAYQNQTSATDSKGDPLDAASLPYVVIPLPSATFDYNAAGLHLGSVVAVIYKGKLQYAVFGDEGPKTIIGEASYATAKSLGINPDPSTGGVDSGVTYIAFTGATGVVTKIEDNAEAVQVGEKRAAQLITDN